MADAQTLEDPRLQIEAARKAFEQEFERFAGLMEDSSSRFTALDLPGPESVLRDLGELRIRHLGKKSNLAASKKMIGRISSNERASFGQLVQQIEAGIAGKVEGAEQWLRTLVRSARTARRSN